jgi:ribulose-5-phosphate 4-epimerase/fuculose-1-phosphate aldolase
MALAERSVRWLYKKRADLYQFILFRGETTVEQLHNLKQLLVTACKVLANEGLTDAFGHISVRIPGTDTFCIPAFLSPALVRESDLLVLDFEGKVIEGNSLPNREVYIHSECYRWRPDVGSVCHSHSPMVKVFASLGEPLKPIENVARFLRRRPLFISGWD